MIVASGWRMAGPAQRAGRSARARGSAAQAPALHPLEYQMSHDLMFVRGLGQ